jgi:predicted CXXCH cytochrome family protein
MTSSLDDQNCAWCHDSGSHHYFPAQWRYSGHDATDFDGRGFHGGHSIGAFAGYAGGRSGCAACHSGAGYVQWDKEGKPTNSIGLPGSISTVPVATTITCAVCHDPHDATEPHQLRLSDTQLGDGTPVTVELYGTGAQCMECHRSRREAATYSADPSNGSGHYGPHHGPQADMLIGANAPDYGMEYPTSPHAVAGGNACVDCHMAGEHAVDENGVVSPLGGHSFNMNDTEGNDHVEVCAPCHGEVGETFKVKKYFLNGNADHDGDGTEEGIQEEIHGMMEELLTYLPQDSLGHIDMSSKTNSVTVMKGGYVYMWIEEDRSFGIHNPAFSVALLTAALESFKYGAIEAGQIMSVTDIPMDQGNQVRVIWTKFGADDGVARDQVKGYTVLRQVNDMMPKSVASYGSIDEMPAELAVGSNFVLDGHLWDVVANVNAHQFVEYSVVAPTLYNTVGADTAWTTFKVLGQTESGIIAETEPMAGYSTDDLAPVTPTGLVAELDGAAVQLTWDAPYDKDVDNFEVYRSVDADFDINTAEFLGAIKSLSFTDASLTGQTISYSIVAVDFSENASENAVPVTVIITGVADELAGIPTEFEMSQNYPNPFNPSTQIKFGLPADSDVRVTVYNAVGKEVATLVNEHLSAGYHVYTWNAVNNASGVYFYQIQTDNIAQVKKMILVK